MLTCQLRDMGLARVSAFCRNDSATTDACSHYLAKEVTESGFSLLTRSVAHLCLPGGPAQCWTLTRENRNFCLQQIRCVRPMQLRVRNFVALMGYPIDKSIR